MANLPEKTRAAVRAALAERHISQTVAARVMHLAPQSLSDRLLGHARFQLEDIDALADYLGIRPAQLLEPPALLVDDEGEASDER